MVQSIVISRHETMNGTGYPYGLSKKNIPLLTRVYSVICSYEALSQFKSPTQVIYTLKEWGIGGYFDHNILRIFLEELEMFGSSGIDPSGPLTERPLVSPHRKNRYESWIQHYNKLLSLVCQIEDSYEEVRECYDDKATQSRIFLKINKLRLSLLKTADTRKMYMITLHGPTPSDSEPGQPGHDQEVLNER